MYRYVCTTCQAISPLDGFDCARKKWRGCRGKLRRDRTAEGCPHKIAGPDPGGFTSQPPAQRSPWRIRCDRSSSWRVRNSLLAKNDSWR